ncbi:MAG TPA: peptidoglycan-binding domain-containing protein [Rhodospirillales bacterium]|nr:peptidoglycan-binding domain-containing protein [Rhodospirillales bacterium]
MPAVSDAAAAPIRIALLGGDPETSSSIRSNTPHPLVRRSQEALARIGLYKGPINGLMGVETKAAVRRYEKLNNMNVTGVVSEELVIQLETASKVDGLLKRLDEVREERQNAAREALLSRPETRHLVAGKLDEQADPTRDSAPCFRDPSPHCLLAEASESAKAIPKEEMRDWALGEILASQAKAGLTANAMATVRRINDTRLIMVALRDIAEALAKAGYIDEALAASKIIPDPLKMTDALASIAEILAEHDNAEQARRIVTELVGLLSTLEDPLRRITLRTIAAKILNRIGDTESAMEQIGLASKAAVSNIALHEQGKALRHVAAALAEMGRPADALGMMVNVDKPQDRIPVLIAAATAQADAGDSQLAIATAENIETARYRAVVFGNIAIAEAQAGNFTQARTTVDRARILSAEIELQYARSFAASRIALALTELGKSGELPFYDEAVNATDKIADDQLRAHILWMIAGERARAGDTAGASRTEALARAATDQIKSPLSRVWMYGDIASNNLAAGDEKAARAAFRNALSVAESVHNPWARARALSRLAAALIEIDQANGLDRSGLPGAPLEGASPNR